MLWLKWLLRLLVVLRPLVGSHLHVLVEVLNRRCAVEHDDWHRLRVDGRLLRCEVYWL